ncbi:O-linked N-acetylglucosamine transferase, SPINDLY family protein [Wenzhouxiangella marina]|uniref:O-linked N-acetylglucosamine transferase, SPINDLY family protein n=1 Tax=Wenzhouxiangella marina TaxID=1579979 RepID=UPI00067356CA|nr:tetratricopeptide repeat protein [Wenzhouxiangella marina]MBB6086877.1 putative O-linked N-acetylglucosamine transferase (SPINDLY family) [Wenzhouxiangella marina]
MSQDWYQIRSELQARLQGEPGDVVSWSNLAYAQLRCGATEQARLAAEHALNLDDRHVAAWVNLGASHLQARRLEDAEEAARTAIELDPGDASSHLFASHVARETGQISQAQDALLTAVRLDPRHADAWSQLALVQMELGLPTQALASINRALEIEPSELRYHSNRMMVAQYHPELDSQALREMALRFGRQLTDSPLPPPPSKPGTGPLRVAYLSPDFYAHPVGYLLRNVLTAHDPVQVEASLWDLRPGNDWLSEEYRALDLPWRDVGGLSDQALAEALRAAEIDVLVDLAGHTAHNRLGVLARRPARLQLSFLGWFGAIGAPGLDALLMGEDQLPAGHEHGFAEAVHALPGSHFRYRPLPYAPEPDLTRKPGPLRLGCFNNTAKLQSEVLDAWAEILRALPEAELELRWKTLADAHVRTSLSRRFQAAGVEPQRLRLLGACGHEELLRAYRQIDLALDPFPFSGGMTSLEALSMGVPVITLAQLRPVSRQTHSMLKALGLAELSTTRVRDYVDTAVELGRDATRRHALRARLIDGYASSPLADAGSLAANLETAYLKLLDRLDGR